MKTKWLFGIFFLLSLALSAQDTRMISAEGVASVGADPAAARDKAIEDALRRAVEQAVGTMVESETTVENYQLLSDRIYSHSSGYVKHYEVTSETRDGGLVRVKISAEVDSGDLNNDLSAIGLLQKRMKYPRVMVMIAEDNVLGADYWQTYSVSTSQSEAQIAAKLKAKGFNVVDPMDLRRQVSADEARSAWSGQYDVAGRMGTRVGAEIVIIGQAVSTRAAGNIYGSDLLSVSSSINARAVKSGTGEVIAQGTGQGTAAHINAVAAMQQSLQKASDQLADQLISGILQTWQKETSGTRNLVVQIQDVSAGELEKIKTALERARGVTDVLVRNFSNGLAEINIQAKTDAQDLSDAISKTKISGFRLVLLDSSADRLEYKVVH